MTTAGTRPRIAISDRAAGLVAGVALIASLLGPTWLALFGSADATFNDLRKATRPAAAPGLQHAYFGWLAWTLTLATIAALVAAYLAGGVASRVGATLAILLSVIGIVVTLWCVKQLDVEDPKGSFWTHFSWVRWGGYLHVFGWVTAIAGGVLAVRSADNEA